MKKVTNAIAATTMKKVTNAIAAISTATNEAAVMTMRRNMPMTMAAMRKRSSFWVWPCSWGRCCFNGWV